MASWRSGRAGKLIEVGCCCIIDTTKVQSNCNLSHFVVCLTSQWVALLREVGRCDGIEQKCPLYTGCLKAMDKFEGVKKIQNKMTEGRTAHGLK
jgi:hypothetical protein